MFPAKPEQFLMSFFRTGIAPPALASFGWEQKPRVEHKMTDANQSFDARRMAKEQEGRMAASASIGFNAVKPFIQFQISMMRVFAENIDRVARNYEKSFETVSNVITQQGSESRREAA